MDKQKSQEIHEMLKRRNTPIVDCETKDVQLLQHFIISVSPAKVMECYFSKKDFDQQNNPPNKNYGR